MTAAIALAVTLGAAVGAPMRFGTERLLLRLAGSRLPWGTALVNVAGSAVLGVVIGAARTGGLSPWWVALLGTGFCGALTTFSGFSAQVLELTVPSTTPEGSQAPSLRGLIYATCSVAVGVAVAAAAYALVT